MSSAEQSNTLPHMTYEEFLDWADEDTLAEWVDGEIAMTSPASDRHQDVMLFIADVLRPYVKLHQLGKVQVAPFQMKLRTSGREPDVLFIAKDHLDRLRRTYLDGPADLAVEIISPESAQRDRTQKFFEYQAAGIPEYWLIDPDTQTAEFHQLDEHGSYRKIAPDADGRYHALALPGLWLRVAWLWQKPLPDPADVLFEVAGEAYLRDLLGRAKRHGLSPTEG